MLVEIGIGAVLDEAAIAGVERQRLGQRARELLGDLGRRLIEAVLDAGKLVRQAKRAASQSRSKCVRRTYRRVDRSKIARTASTKCEPRQGAGEIGRLSQVVAQGLPQARLVGEIRHGIE